jgi:hypothetical protein
MYRGTHVFQRETGGVKTMTIDGFFDWSPNEETRPIWVLERLAICYGRDIEIPQPPTFTIRLHKSPVFGTGGHPATKAAIWSMIETAREQFDGKIPSPFLELGETSGLLALLAAHGGAEDAHFVSDSIEAQALADDNGILNGHDLKIGEAAEFFGMWQYVREMHMICEPRLRMFATQSGGSHGVLTYLPEIYDSMMPGGVAIWSGQSSKQSAAIRHQVGEFFGETSLDDFEGWPCLRATKAR